MEAKTEKLTQTAEKNGINIQNERSLHAGIKTWFAQEGDRFEVPVGGFVIDLVRDNLLVEVQTRNFAAFRPKLKALLLAGHFVHVVHPVTAEKWVIQVDKKINADLSRRKSPFKGALTDLFEELVRIPDLITHPQFTIEFLYIKEEEVRCRDGKGSKWRKKVSIIDRRLVEVVSRHHFSSAEDFLLFIPASLPQQFSNKELAKALHLPLHRCRQITYSLRKMEALCLTGKKGNELLFEVNKASSI